MNAGLAPLSGSREAATAATILFFSASSRTRSEVSGTLSTMGLTVSAAESLRSALEAIAEHGCTICLIDLAHEHIAIPAIRAIRAQEPVPIIGLIDPRRPMAAAEAMAAGASGLLSWPCEARDIAVLVANARDREGVSFAAQAGRQDLIANSPAMRTTVDLVRAAANLDAGVTVCGDPGTGRGLVCRAVHRLSARAQMPFVVVDCAGCLPEELETAMFGTRPETRHPAQNRRAVERITRNGAIYRALGGTVYLANLLEVPERLQAKIARLLRDREATLNERRGRVIVDVRCVASIDVAPEVAIRDGRLRQDLADRLAQTVIDVPPLRDRREDVPVLAVQFLAEMNKASGRQPQRFTRSALSLLAALPWPGNTRELRAVLQAVSDGVRRPVIELEDLFEHVRLDGVRARLDGGATLRDARARFEREWISSVLVKHHGRVSEAARALGIQRTNLYRKVRQLNVARTLLASRR
jgi:two-component system nitrogen regulation response regulator NtrX